MVDQGVEGKSHKVLLKLMKRADHCNKSLITVPEGYNRVKPVQYKPRDMNIGRQHSSDGEKCFRKI